MSEMGEITAFGSSFEYPTIPWWYNFVSNHIWWFKINHKLFRHIKNISKQYLKLLVHVSNLKMQFCKSHLEMCGLFKQIILLYYFAYIIKIKYLILKIKIIDK